jgi:histidine triad (HIT) family protein
MPGADLFIISELPSFGLRKKMGSPDSRVIIIEEDISTGSTPSTKISTPLRLCTSYFHRRMMMPTLFTRIIKGQLPGDIVYRDGLVTAFRDIHPAAPIHILIVPNKEIGTVNDLEETDEQIAGRMFLVAKKLAEQEGIAESGYRLIVNCNRDGGQEVYHLHLHLLGGRPLGPMILRR